MGYGAYVEAQDGADLHLDFPTVVGGPRTPAPSRFVQGLHQESVRASRQTAGAHAELPDALGG